MICPNCEEYSIPKDFILDLIPEGWQLVPREATKEILDILCEISELTMWGGASYPDMAEEYKNILEIAPKYGE